MPDIKLSLNAGNYAGVIATSEASQEVHARVDELNAMLREVSQSHPAYASIRSNVNPLFAKAWVYELGLAVPEMPKKRFIYRTHNLSLSTQDIDQIKAADNPSRYFEPKAYFSMETNAFNFCVMHVKRGLGIMDHVREKAEAYGLRHIADIGPHVTMSANHKIDIYEITEGNRFGIIVFTNQNEDELVARILGTIWSYLSAYGIGEKLRASKLAETPFLQLAKILYRQDLNAYIEYVQVQQLWLREYMNSRERLDEMFKGYGAKLQQKVTRNIDQNLQRCQQNIRNYENTLAEEYKKLIKLEFDKTARALGLEGADDKFKELVDYIYKARSTISVVNFNQDDSSLTLDITAPLSNYRIKDVEMYYKRGGENYLTRHPEVKDSFEECFIKEKYDFMTTTRIQMQLDDGNTAGTHDNNSGRFGNPHVQGFDCFRNYKTEISKALTQNNFTMAFAGVINACATITFTDGAVISDFTARVHREADRKLFRSKADGKMYSANEIHEMAKAERKAAEVKIESTPAEPEPAQGVPVEVPTETDMMAM